jgi:hypothetical protein
MEKKKKDDEEVTEWVGGHKVYPGKEEIDKDKDDWLNKPDEYYGFGKTSRRVDKDECEDKE